VAGGPRRDRERHLRVAPASRHLRRQLGPTAWAVLEDIALDADLTNAGRLVATTSARRVADNLGLTPGTAARALSRLRALGLVAYTRQSGAAGRFGPSAYVLGPLVGIDVRWTATGGPVPPTDCGKAAGEVQPSAGDACAAVPSAVEPGVEDVHMGPRAKAASARRSAVAASLPEPHQLELLAVSDAPATGSEAGTTGNRPGPRSRALGTPEEGIRVPPAGTA
jgi:hypothetical protein